MAMEKKLLAINIGSASKKYALYYNGAEILGLHLEKESDKIAATAKSKGKTSGEMGVSQADYDNAAGFFIELAKKQNLISDKSEIEKIGIRVVAPGKYFTENKIISGEYLAKLESAKEQAPLHINPTLEEIRKILKVIPEAKLYGVSDSVFYKDMPFQAKLYGLSSDIAEKLEIYRYGYHGISMQSVMSKTEKILGSIPSRTIICHLGSGSSITAVKDGKAADTSMGFTPLEGLPMGTRVGNIDAGAVIYLAKKSGMNLEELESYFNNECGLLGLSGKSQFVKELIDLDKAGDEKSKMALDLFVYGVKKLIGAYAAILNGLDLIIFTATVGQRSSFMRDKICSGLETLGITLDNDKNRGIENEGEIGSGQVKIMVITTDEMNEIAQEVAGL